MAVSILMSIYAGELPAYLSESLQSLASQSLRPSEVIVVKDGPLTQELDDVLACYANNLPLKTIPLSKNVGLGPALAAGLEQCRFELVARMDADDICPPYRLEAQVDYLRQNPTISVVAGAAAEFEEDCSRPNAIRSAPPVARSGPYAYFRNPISHHSAVLFRKTDVQAAGGYQHCPFFEDYNLWARMILKGYRLHNLPETMVLVRAGKGIIERRRGLAYLQHEVRFLWRMNRLGFLPLPYLVANLIFRVPCRLLPAVLLRLLYSRFLRRTGVAPNE